MRKFLFSRSCRLTLILLVLLSLLPLQAVGFAAGKNDDPFSSIPNFGSITDTGLVWRNSATGYRVVIEDEIDLLTSVEERQLLEDMIPLTEYGNAAFWSTRESASSELIQAEAKRRALFDLESAGIFVINMELRTDTIQSYGRIYDVITVSRANSITNNVRGELTKGHYYNASRDAFSQMDRLMRGERIAQPMKVLSNACIALMIGLLLMLSRVFRYATTFRRPAVPQIIGVTALAFTAGAVAYKGTKRSYSPSDNGGSSSSGSFGGGGGGGGGGGYTGGGGSSHF